MNRMLAAFLFLFTSLTPVGADDTQMLVVTASPAGYLPLGSSSNLFNVGGGLNAGIAIYPYFDGVAGFGFDVQSRFIPLEVENGIWTVAGIGRAAGRYPLTERLTILGDVGAGYYYWDALGWEPTGAGNGGGLALWASLGARFQIAGPVSLGVRASYARYARLYQGTELEALIQVDIPVVTRLGRQADYGDQFLPIPLQATAIEFEQVVMPPLFPVLYRYYTDNPIGSVTVRNSEDRPIENLRVSIYVDRYMDNPHESIGPEDLPPGARADVPLYALFTEDLIQVTEGTTVSGVLVVTYDLDDDHLSQEETVVVEFHNRNAIVWDDDRRIASFVTARDPEILGLSGNVLSWIQNATTSAVDEGLQLGMALFSALKVYGIGYKTDPGSGTRESASATGAVDFLQFPRQTLQYTNGDCDDLSILYASLLEAVGVETAVITVPGHIYGAFALKMSPEEARHTFARPDDLIFLEDRAWVPLETTMLQDSFDEAWQTGARQWREAESNEQARLYVTRDAWELYRAVGFREPGSGLELPDRAGVVTDFEQALALHIDREISSEVSRIESRLARAPDRSRPLNQLGVLYARYGLYDDALMKFNEVLAEGEHPSALINIANIHYLRAEYVVALEFYQRAADIAPESPVALLGLAQCNRELENYGLVRSAFSALEESDPELAERYAYLDLRGQEATRAADAAGLRTSVIWEEVE